MSNIQDLSQSEEVRTIIINTMRKNMFFKLLEGENATLGKQNLRTPEWLTDIFKKSLIKTLEEIKEVFPNEDLLSLAFRVIYSVYGNMDKFAEVIFSSPTSTLTKTMNRLKLSNSMDKDKLLNFSEELFAKQLEALKQVKVMHGGSYHMKYMKYKKKYLTLKNLM